MKSKQKLWKIFTQKNLSAELFNFIIEQITRIFVFVKHIE